VDSGWEVRREARLQGTLDSVPESCANSDGYITLTTIGKLLFRLGSLTLENRAPCTEGHNPQRDGQKATKCCPDHWQTVVVGEDPR